MLASATDHSLIQLLGIIMASTGSFTAMAIFWTTPDQVISLQSRAVALAVINAIGNVGSAVSPLLIGILRDTTGSFSSGLWFVAGLLVVGALVLTRIPMTQRDQQRNDHVPEPYRQHRYQQRVRRKSGHRRCALSVVCPHGGLFGRDMQAHRHDQFFQMHFLDTGQIELQLDDHRYSVQAPLFVLTPPSVPHAFITESDSDGHVLTVREDLIWPLLEVLYPGTRETFGLPGICLSLADKPDELAALKHYWRLIERESTEQLPGREHTLVLLAQAVFTLLLRNAKLDDHAASGMRGELKLFQRFNQMIDTHYHQHWTVPDYACELHLTESRLTDICRRFANRPPKRLIFDRQLREAKRLLLFPTAR
jgi:AraC family 4-hydroxyphenylacetate 3-monooxygenase operon regulatory protein